MNTLRQTNTFSRGMNMDLDYSVIPSSQYKYAENVRIISDDSNTNAVLQSIEGLSKINIEDAFVNEIIIHTNTIRNIGIIFTKSILKSNSFNIYKLVLNEDQDNPTITKIISNLDLDLNEIDGKYPISSVCRWESDDNVKIYWCDGKNQIRVLNVCNNDYNYTNLDQLNIVPAVNMKPFYFKDFTSGSLKAGKYQFCYQLYNIRGSETNISPLSNIIHVNKDDGNSNSNDIIGSEQEENTNKGIVLTTELQTDVFNRVRIFSIYYKDNTSIPEINICDDIHYSKNFSYIATNNSVLNEITKDELNTEKSYNFVPKVLESKDNILFAANIKESTWDIPIEKFDSRAYRCNKNGEIVLKSVTSEDELHFSISEIDTFDVPYDHDCLCPYNIDDSEEYKFLKKDNNSNSYVYGGQGKNIKYELITTNLIEDDSKPADSGKAIEDFNVNSKILNVDFISINGVDSNGENISLGNEKLNNKKQILNYSSQEIDSRFRSYQRDEIYRFGIIFYNKFGSCTPVHWIADIRMPKLNEKGFNTFSTNVKVNLSDNTSTDYNTVVTHPLGVRFTVKNLPSEVIAYEIVRCERTILDRKILMQGVISTITNYGDNPGSLYPLPYLSYSAIHGYQGWNDKYNYIFRMSDYSSQEYFIFISPDLCVNKENISEIISNTQMIEGLKILKSEIEPDSTISSGGVAKYDTKVLANAKVTKDINGNFVNVSSQTHNSLTGYSVDPLLSGSKNIILFGEDGFYSTSLAKYYFDTDSGNLGLANIDDIAISTNIEPFDITDSKFLSKGTVIGSKTYYNWVYDHKQTDVTEDANNTRKMGPHGICAIFKSSDMLQINNLKGTNDESNLGNDCANAILLANIIQNITPYGGNSYAIRQNSIYIPTGSYVTVDKSESTTNCFGGDTYIGIFDYANCMFLFDAGDYNVNNTNRLYNGMYIPLESTINLSLRSDDIQTSKTYQSNGYSNHFVQENIIQIGQIYSQDKPLYSYNSAYSVQPNARFYTSKSIYNIDNLNTDVRVMASEPKTNNEVSDSWTKFKVANYIDVNTEYGPINQIKSFKNTLFFWQTDAFGLLAVNERSLITDNNIGSLTLGTGGILTRFDYITNNNGVEKDQLMCVNSSDNGLYWYDYNKNELCNYNGRMNIVSKLNGVQSYLNKNKIDFNNNPITLYDKKYNEVLFKLKDDLLVFNEQTNCFTSFYKINLDFYLKFTESLYLLNNNNLYKYNSGEESNLINNNDKISYVQFVINDNYPQTKTFDNVEYSGDFSENTNFNEIYFETKRQTSYLTTDKDIDYREDTYKFCIPRNNIELNESEQLANKSYKDRMKGKYLICHYKYDCNNGNTFKVPYISTAYRNSMI